MKRIVLAFALLLAPVTLSIVPNAFAQGDSQPKKAKKKPQTELAAKGAFPVVKAGDPKVKGAVSATDLKKATTMANKNVQVVGTVDKAFAPKSNNLVLLNFAKNYKTALVGAVMAKDFAKFLPLTQLKGKKVLISGKLVIFKGAPEVQLDKAGAIALVK